jgi:hypothetical protein
MNSKEKATYRRSKEWKKFRKDLIAERKHCQWCGSKFRLNVHHQDPENYTNLDKTKFLLLCNGCHKFWELKLSIKNKDNFIPEYKKIIDLFTGKN